MPKFPFVATINGKAYEVTRFAGTYLLDETDAEPGPELKRVRVMLSRLAVMNAVEEDTSLDLDHEWRERVEREE